VFRRQNVFQPKSFKHLQPSMMRPWRVFHMKKISMVAGLVFLAALLAFSVSSSVNNTSGNFHMQGVATQADGSPIPPLPPCCMSSSSTLSADGSPIPPLPPQFAKGAETLIADGSPIPPLPPCCMAIGSALTADGSPIPPLPPYFSDAVATLVADGNPILPLATHSSSDRAAA